MTAATPAQPAPVSPHLGCAVCASGVTVPHGEGGTPGQAGIDPSSTAYRVHAHAFNTLTERLAHDDQFMPLSARDAIASAIVAAVEPIIRADARDLAVQEPHAAPELAAARDASDLEVALIIAERNQLRMVLQRLADDGNLEVRDRLAAIRPELAAAMRKVRSALEDSPTASIARREALEIINALGLGLTP